jgi:Xaa-Pro aminopeptidase
MVLPPVPDWPGRLSRVQQRLPTLELDALVVSSPPNILYLTGFAGSAGLLVVTSTEVRLLVDGRYDLVARQSAAAGLVAPVTITRVEGRYDQALAQTISWLGPRRVGFEAGHVTVATLRAWERGAAGHDWRPTDQTIERLREIKDDFEIGIFRRGGRLIDQVAARLPDLIRPGRSEQEIAELIDRSIREVGFSRPAFSTIVASGPNSARPHARPGDRRLTAGDLVVLDFGGILDGYCLDLTRMASVGTLSRDAQALFDAVLAAHQAAVEAVRPQADGWQVDRAARALLESRGLGEAFSHSTGHGLGIEVHEAPRVGRPDPDAPVRLEVGMVFTIEPGAYLEHVGGVRVEDDVLVTETGAELLTTAPRELIAV